MIINAIQIVIKQSPAGTQGMSVSLSEFNPNILPPSQQTSANIDTSTFNQNETNTLNAFIALINSKM